MEKVKNHLSHITLSALLVLVISVGAWAFLELASIGGDFNSPDENHGRRGSKRLIREGVETPMRPPSFEPVSFQTIDAVQFSGHAVFRGPARQAMTGGGTQKPDVHPTTSGAPPIDSISNRKDSTGVRTPRDSLGTSVSTDSSAVPDSVSLDSLKLSAWLQELRPSQPQAPIFEEYEYPLFLYSGVIQHTTTIDSTGQYVEIRETLLNHDIRVPLQIPLDEYIALNRKHYVKSTWEDLAHAYTLQEAGGLQSLMAGVTNISIPIPSNPVLSIFGPPRINLRISGAVDIHGGWQNQKINAQSLSQLGNTTNQPDFKQDVSINVSGTVGDKLNIGANWDTQNQFDYENQLKIQYTGYPDEVIQSVEAGNVSMSTPSSFVGSNQALFGIKTKMQFGPLTLTALASQQKAQSKTLSVSNGSSSQAFSLHAYQYATNHFFIDSMYIGGYENYLQKQEYVQGLYVTDCEVYISQPTNAPNSNLRYGYAVINLMSGNTLAGKAYYDSLRAVKSFNQTSWQIQTGRFQKLDPTEYILDPKTGVLTLNTSVQTNQIVAVAFTTAGGEVYGTLTSLDTTNLPLVLNMVVPTNPIPSETDAWRLMLRNIYPTGGLNLDQNSLKNVQITYTAPGQSGQDNINNVNLLQIFGLDKTGPNGNGPPDGQMDWNP
ncbi:MAG: cell surface protein SprA, partial [Bacteroidetes bacterium]|nr:cell surface protein SprA [Bacteroidota bacterium]